MAFIEQDNNLEALVLFSPSLSVENELCKLISFSLSAYMRGPKALFLFNKSIYKGRVALFRRLTLGHHELVWKAYQGTDKMFW